MSLIETRLKDLDIHLPEAAAPAANYVPFVVSGTTVYISGQLPMKDGVITCTGQVGDTVSPEDAKNAARLCAINIIAQAKQAAGGDLERIDHILKLGGFVSCTTGFGGQPAIINGASDLMVDVFAERGRHARFAVGTNALPFDATVEIEAIVQLKN